MTDTPTHDQDTPGLESLFEYELAELCALRKACAVTGPSRSARLLAQRRQSKARSTMPWRLRQSRADFPVWQMPSDAPSLISLYAKLFGTEDAPGESPELATE